MMGVDSETLFVTDRATAEKMQRFCVLVTFSDFLWSELRRRCTLFTEDAINDEVRRICREHFPKMEPPVFRVLLGGAEEGCAK